MTADDQPLMLGNLPEKERSAINAAIERGPVIHADLVSEVTVSLGINIEQLMIALLPAASAHARIPISGFPVGAIALGSTTGNLYLGANIEFPSHALSFSVHGEQSAANNAWLHNEEALDAVAANEVPCGYCRQFLTELTGSVDLQILLRTTTQELDDSSHSAKPLSYYLRDSFGPRDLGVTGGLMDPQANGLSLDSDEELVQLALDAANSSYSPYTGDFAGVALRTGSGDTYTGRYAENAAFNPSLSPLQSAVASLNMHESAQAPYDIVAAVLVEAGGAKISQLSATKAVLASIAPEVELQHHFAK